MNLDYFTIWSSSAIRTRTNMYQKASHFQWRTFLSKRNMYMYLNRKVLWNVIFCKQYLECTAKGRVYISWHFQKKTQQIADCPVPEPKTTSVFLTHNKVSSNYKRLNWFLSLLYPYPLEKAAWNYFFFLENHLIMYVLVCE